MDKKNPIVVAVVVTYNRLELLKENIQALQDQSYKLGKIIIVNNNSNDGTKEYITQTFGEDRLFSILNLEKNVGGAGGFYEGIKHAVKNECDWIWVMDDDAIPTPNALIRLVEKINIVENTGFLCSRVLFTDDTPHLMNNTEPKRNEVLNIEWNAFFNQNILTVPFASFVSCLINVDSVRAVGLPYRDFFIWNDDFEFTSRVINAKFFGGLVLDSIVYHKTKANYRVDLITADDSLAWKYFYGERNRVFLEKKRRSKIGFIIWYFRDSYKTYKNLRLKSGNKKLKKSIKSGRRKGIFFKPKIDFI